MTHARGPEPIVQYNLCKALGMMLVTIRAPLAVD